MPNVNLTGVEITSNKSTSVVIDQTSNTKYPSVKSVYDWAVFVFTTTSAVATQITTALTGYATTTQLNLRLTQSATSRFSHTALSVLDATTYFFGILNTTASTSTTVNRRGVAPFSGFVYSVGVNVIVATVLGTTEQSTLRINNKTAGTSVTVSTVIQYDASGQYYAYTLGSPFAVTVGDMLEIEVNMPTFATNPTGVQHIIDVIFSKYN
jgi:hypothetical protein